MINEQNCIIEKEFHFKGFIQFLFHLAKNKRELPQFSTQPSPNEAFRSSSHATHITSPPTPQFIFSLILHSTGSLLNPVILISNLICINSFIFSIFFASMILNPSFQDCTCIISIPGASSSSSSSVINNLVS